MRAESAFAWDFGFHGQSSTKKTIGTTTANRTTATSSAGWLSRIHRGTRWNESVMDLSKTTHQMSKIYLGSLKGSLLGNERIKIVVGPLWAIVNGVRSLPNSWVGVDPITSEEEVERNISLAKSNYSNSNMESPCPVEQLRDYPAWRRSPDDAQSTTNRHNSGADYYLLLPTAQILAIIHWLPPP